VINGWKDKGNLLDERNPEYRPANEYDFLIISEPLHSIIHIEVKRKCIGEAQEKAADQLSCGLNFFQKIIPFQTLKDWQYVQVMYFGSDDEKIDGNDELFNNSDFCTECQRLIIGPKTNFCQWWMDISAHITSRRMQYGQDNTTYLIIMKYLLYQVSISSTFLRTNFSYEHCFGSFF
jgi:hypothetical protein